jgi:hypothetical protein
MAATKKLADYWIFYSATYNELSSLVRENMTLGWQPLGAPVVTSKGQWHQAMVR